ncbi:unnamed protein product, partial [Allacma fusca]
PALLDPISDLPVIGGIISGVTEYLVITDELLEKVVADSVKALDLSPDSNLGARRRRRRTESLPGRRQISRALTGT